MRKYTSRALIFAACVGGCAAQPATPGGAVLVPAAKPADDSFAAAELGAVLERRIGDYTVHMISGSFRKQPAMLTERVVGREGDGWILELELEDADGKKTLRAWMDGAGEVFKVVRVFEKGDVPARLADYEALLASVSVTPDENEGLAATTKGTCTVGPSELDCETKSYRVRLGEREASLGITQSASIPGRDVAGEITLADGTVVFRSELLDRGNRPAPSDSVAIADPVSAESSAQK